MFAALKEHWPEYLMEAADISYRAWLVLEKLWSYQCWPMK